MKVIHTAAVIIGTVAAVASVVLPFTPFAFLAPIARLVAVGAGLVAAATGALMSKPKGTVAGSPTDFKADPQAAIPYMVGRSYQEGYIVHRDTFGTKGLYQAFVIVWSLGMIEAFDGFLIDNVATTFSGEAPDGTYNNWMWLARQQGASPEASALPSSRGTLPGWDSTSKLSGLAAGLWTLKFDTAGKVYAGGVPKFGAIIKGVRVYDPRLDSTYPGGSGSCRALDETTYVYSENPWLHALTFALGRFQNGKRVMGVGMPVASIDVAAFVEAANIADVNGWKVGGTVSSGDDKWNVLKMMAQAGGGECMRVGARLSCLVSTPRVVLATITSKDIVGRSSVTATQKRRDRINGAVPRIRSEAHGWEVIPLDVVRGDTYLTEDGAERTREIDLQLVQDVNQGAQLSAYAVADSREFSPVSVALKPVWLGYKPGDCLACDIPELGLNGQPCIQLTRELEPSSGKVTMTLRSETNAKHAWALAHTGTAPPTPSLGAPDFAAIHANYLIDSQITTAIGLSYTRDLAGNVTQADAGTDITVPVPSHTRVYPNLSKEVAVTGATITGLAYSSSTTGVDPTTYLIYYDDPDLTGGAVTYHTTTVPADGYFSETHPYRHFVAYIVAMQAGGGTGGTGGGSVGGSGTPGSGGWGDQRGLEAIP